MSSPATPRYVNGRILLREAGGVQRYAAEVAKRLPDTAVLMPRSAKRPWSGRLWEQVGLHRASNDGVLLNMAHGGPLRHPRQVNVIHDLLALTDPRGVHPAYAALQRQLLPRHIAAASQLVTVSRRVADQVIDLFDVGTDQLSVVPPGISTVFRPGDRHRARVRLGLRAEEPVVAALLDPTPRKNSAAVADLLRQLQHDDPRVQVVVAGRHDPAMFAATANAPGVDRQAFVDLGAVPDEELATMYQAADVFVALSSAEGFGLPMVEAAVCGAAVVTTEVPSIREYGLGAALVIADAGEASAAVSGLLRDANRRREITAKALETLGDLQWDDCAASLGVIMSQVATA